MAPPPRMLLLGAGLSGGLLALALAELGVEVELVTEWRFDATA